MHFRVSADDFGLTESVTDDISKAVDAGSVDSVSIMANGYAFEHAMREFGKRPGLHGAVHLNLREGKPVMPTNELGLLVNSAGELHHSFQRLWLLYATGGARKRRRLKEQVKGELDAQITKVKKGLGLTGPIAINSHQHFHFIPFVFDALMELHEKHEFSYVRMATEPFFVSADFAHAARTIFPMNVIKHVLLNRLSRKHKAVLRERGIAHPEFFFGVLYSGFMNEPTIKAALKKAGDSSRGELSVELLVHPGRAHVREAGVWHGHAELEEYYCSTWRETERLSIMSTSVKSLLDSMRTKP